MSIARIVLTIALSLLIVPKVALAGAVFSLELSDATTKQPITGARIALQGTSTLAADLGKGRYSFDGLHDGRYQISITRTGYRDASTTIDVPGMLSLQLFAKNEATDLQTIASVHSTANSSGANGTVLNTTIGSVDLDRTATFRLADALLNLPELTVSTVPASQTNTSAATAPTAFPLLNGPGSYVQMSIRGFGTIESPALIDGHPIAQGIDLGFDYQDAPTFGLSSVFVGYGSDAAALYGVGGAGVIDMRTLLPTAKPSFDVLQGTGSYGLAATALRWTGSTSNGRVGWAFAYGVQGTGGPLFGKYFAPTASLDPSDPTDRRAATYNFSDDTNRRNILGKLRFTLGNDTTLVVKAFDATTWADGTGENSDGVYMPTLVATAQGQQLLAAKSPADTCPAGTFTAYSQLVDPNTFAPLPQSVPCQTPQQYGAFNMGFQGIGPHYVAERASDYSATLSTTYESVNVNLDLFTNSYFWNYNRGGALPYSNPNYPFGAEVLPYLTLNQLVVNTGGTLTLDKQMGAHDPYVVVRVMNNTNDFNEGPGASTAPVVWSSSTSFGDHWTGSKGRLQLDAGGVFSRNGATNDGSSFDSHVSLSDAVTSRDRVRFSAGTSTISPAALWLDFPYSPVALGDFQATIDCSAPNSVGTVPSSALTPERIADQEVTVNHDWGGGAFTTVDVYNAWLNNKIYATAVPVSMLPAGTIPDSELAPYQNALAGACGSSGTLAAAGNFNIGSVRAQGADVIGRLPIPGVHRLSLDYSYSIQSSVLEAVNSPDFLPYNLTFIPGSQLPGVPLHKYTLGVDYGNPDGINATLRRYWSSANNPSNLPAYAFSDLAIGVPITHGLRAHLMVENLFNEHAGDYALTGLGVPLALNRYATAANYAPYVGYGATTFAPLAPRTFLLSLEFRGL